MYVNASGASVPPPTRPAEDGTTTTLKVDANTVFTAWHRTAIHPSAQHGCPLCPSTPCACGFDGYCCPQYFEHRRGEAGSETSWRVAA